MNMAAKSADFPTFQKEPLTVSTPNAERVIPPETVQPETEPRHQTVITIDAGAIFSGWGPNIGRGSLKTFSLN